MPLSRRLVALATAALLAHLSTARVQLPAIFSDGAVLQTNAEYGARSFMYGWAAPGEQVALNQTSAAGAVAFSYAVTADADGDWVVQLNPMGVASNPEYSFSISVAGSSDGYAEVTTIRGLRAGDVFICSGQSNMVFSVQGAFGGPAIAARSYPNIQLFSVVQQGAPTPQRDFAPAGNASVCWWSRTPAPNVSSSGFRCNTWLPAAPGITSFFSASCFMTAQQATQLAAALLGDRPIGLIQAAVGGTSVELWQPPGVEEACGGTTTPNRTGWLFNGMIAPLVRYTPRAFLWYQGEADKGERQPVDWYSCRFRGLIDGWRALWRMGDVPFVYAQLAPYMPPATALPDYSDAGIRAQQALAQPAASESLDGPVTTGMAVLLDLGDPTSPYGSIHPRWKVETGRRLALQVLHVAYALQYRADGLNFTGPAPQGAAPASAAAGTSGASAGAVVLTFRTLDGSGVFLNGTAFCWQCDCATAGDTVQVSSGADGPWVNTSLSLPTPTSPLLATPVVPGAYTRVRFGAATYPQCAIYALGSRLPAAPFVLNISAVGTAAGSSSAVSAAPDAAAERRACSRAAAASLDKSRAALVPVAQRGPHTWSEWRGRPIAAPAEGAQAPTPPMGFNSWNAFHANCDERLVARTADALLRLGLADLGFRFVNIDDAWQVERAPDGTIVEDPVRYPSGIAALADYVHGLGLSFGLYTAQGSVTCQKRPGAYGHELQDSATYCGWGLDYLKIDDCGGTMHAQGNTSWALFKQGWAACAAGGGKVAVQSVEYCGTPPGVSNSCAAWIRGVANLWRTHGDVQATWGSILANLDANNAMAPVAGPGGWNDPDMLEVGAAGLSLVEQRAQVSLWAVVAAPLLISMDLVSPPATQGGAAAFNATIAILSNPEVLAVSQDPLGVQGVLVSAGNATGSECWARPLADGTVAAALLNRGDGVADAACSWLELGLKDPNGAADVRDLWARADLGRFTGGYSARGLAPHSAALVRVMPMAVAALAGGI